MEQLDNRFPAERRLRKRRDFIKCKQMGRIIHTSHFLVFALKRDDEQVRLGVTVSRRVGGAVTRNRVKRLIREFFRTRQQQLPKGFDLSIIAKGHAGNIDLATVCSELEVLLRPEVYEKKRLKRSCSGKS
ncbi:ribonuclease P protein component [Geothermobacter ehrlichii]|uniref:Ribonuclease P protein component n=1 Tax=Geothermobacter ehrlichii TaxID=213224 RepID=A0A5D3WIG2_9BACT|nr:ribonuclease P protein component [Geothermobacter ehrlichii]TYO97667.1 ribonuclease P protein component [Geothermobacter ehrlichii]